MILSDFHTHTYYSDGKASPEEMIKKAISLGYKAIGISDHSYVPYDLSYCMTMLKTGEYLNELSALKEKYEKEISVFIGIEQDLYSTMPCGMFDYAIGSVHYIRSGNTLYPIDHSKELFVNLCEKHFGGNYIELCKTYFESVSQFAAMKDIKVIGHFDVVTKFNEGNCLFDENDPFYKRAALAAIRKLISAGKILEINTGAMSRGFRTAPYPARFLLEELQAWNGRVIFGSDAHSPEDIGKYFTEAEVLAQRCGINRIKPTPVI